MVTDMEDFDGSVYGLCYKSNYACFVCHEAKGPEALPHSGVDFFVYGYNAGHRIIDLFEAEGSVAKIDLTFQGDPREYQVEVGSCENHLPHLEKLLDSSKKAFNKVSPEIIRGSLNIS